MSGGHLRIAGALALVLLGGTVQASPPRDRWSASELQTLAAMHVDRVPARAADPSNAFEGRADAARLGRALFDDTRLSRDGHIACATCHEPSKQFQDGRPVAQGLAAGRRRTMPVLGALHAPFLFWDGRKDSLWSQALGPLEDAAEHGGNRVRIARLVAQAYAPMYEQVFGPLPSLEGLPPDASPAGTAVERAAWEAMSPPDRDRVDRVFANVGKAIAAYESGLHHGPSRFDRYVDASLARDGEGQAALSPQEVRGLRLFLGKGQCATCHQGPLFTEDAFHNTGVPAALPTALDRGRADGVPRLLADEFNCLGPYSDARPGQCGDLDFLSADDPRHLGAFRTPSLRNVASRPPYMHAGQFATLDEAVRHYARSPVASVGRSELGRPGDRHAQRKAIDLSPQEIDDVAALLEALDGPVVLAR